MLQLRSLVLSSCALALTLAACADERPAIDRVQDNALEKSFFIGEDFQSTEDDPEFYMQGTLVDVGYGASQDGLFTSTYAQPLSRIKWVVTEDLLIARITFERVSDSDGKGKGPGSSDGIVAATYKIQSHFDITKAYNGTTGEELNIIEENTRDRPWHERAYMRVDWSKNLATDTYDFDTLSMLGVYGGVTYEPLAYYINDPSDADAPVFDFEGGYFDITTKAFARPQMVDLSRFGWGIDEFPACWLENDFLGGSWPEGNCNPIELTIRQSFRRLVPTDYEPVHWDGYRFQAYGSFYVERYGHTRNYGMSDDKWYRFVARYDLWERSHFYADPQTMSGPVECFTPFTTPFGMEPDRDIDQDGQQDECQVVGGGSKCDTFKQRCTLPYRDRTVKPIVWYYTEGSPEEFYEPTYWAAQEWDVAMRLAVRTAQYTECVSLGEADCAQKWPVYFGQQDDNEDAIWLATEVDACREGRAYADRGADRARCDALADELGAARGFADGVIAIAKMDDVLIMCHSPVADDDPAGCGERGLVVRQGDLRYHQVNVINTPQTPSPWGIYTDAEDPLTGETISASINVWGVVNDRASQGLIDQARYIAGELTTEDITDGENVRKFAEASRAAAGAGVAPRMDAEGLTRRMAAFANTTPERIEQQRKSPTPATHAIAKRIKKQLKQVRASMDAPSSFEPLYQARREAAAGSVIEAQLMTPMVQVLMGITGMPLTPQLMQMASPLRGANPTAQRNLYHFKQLALAERGACMMHEAPAPLAIAAITDVLQEKFGAFDATQSPALQQERAEKMRKYLAKRLHYGVIAHEMGHSIGMRHNFVSSADAWGYRPQYWQLRTRDGSVSTACADLQADGADCVGPRYFDPVTDDEQSQLLTMFMQSSVMDYPGEITQDMLGLGVYDFAAARVFYADVVSVHADPSYNVDTARGSGMLNKMDSFGGITGIEPEIGGNEIHYSQLQSAYELISDCTAVDPNDFKPSTWNDDVDGLWHPVFDGRIVNVDGQYTRCRQQPVDYTTWDALRRPTSAEAGAFYFGGDAIDAQGRVRMPYGFATDGWADVGNLSVYRSDNGADPYELMNFLITQQEVGHIFDNYRRNRQGFSVRSASNRTLHRYNTKIRDAAKGLGLFRNIYKLVSLDEGYDFDDFWADVAPVWFKEQILMSGIGFDHFAKQAARPAEGAHFALAGDSVLRSSNDSWSTAGNTEVTIPNGATGYFGDVSFGGRPMENALPDDQGEYDSEFPLNAGQYYDKLWAGMLFTESVDNFISSDRSEFVDARYRAVSMADLFPDGFRRWLAQNLTGDDELKGARLAADASGQPLLDADGFPAQPIGWTTWWTDTPESCFPGEGSTVCSRFGGADDSALEPQLPANVVPIDPQVGWEQQKFLIAWTLIYLPENQQQWWLDMLRVWELGADADPGFQQRIEFHNPTGKIYVAQTFGKEDIFGKTVQKGIAARVLEYANELMAQAYDVLPGPDLDGDGEPDWWLPELDPATGQVYVKYDPSVRQIDANGQFAAGKPGCNPTENFACTCGSNRACVKLSEYVELPFFLRQALATFGLHNLSMQGIY